MNLLSRFSQKGRLCRTLATAYRLSGNRRFVTSLKRCRDQHVRITAVPDDVLVDEKFAIQVEGLTRGSDVTIQANIREGKTLFTSSGCFQADDNGCVDVTNQHCLAGHYSGVDAMGLIWSMRQAPGQRDGLRLQKKDVTKPQIVNLSVFRGHHTTEDIFNTSPQPLSTTDIQRWYKARDVQRIELSDGLIRGSLFIPPGAGPFPGVIDMYGTGGGLVDMRAALLASRGYVTLALAFFGYQDLPPSMWGIHLDYFKEAVEFLSSHQSVIPGGVGMLGLSKGAELCQFISLHCPQVRAIASISGMPFLTMSPIVVDGETLEPTTTIDPTKFRYTEKGHLIFKDCVRSAEKVPFFPLWERYLPFLNICGTDDQITDWTFQQEQYDDFPDDKKDTMELVVYQGAGHLIEPPYAPLCDIPYHKVFGMTMMNGGVPAKHAHAQEDSWAKIVQFFRKHLIP